SPILRNDKLPRDLNATAPSPAAAPRMRPNARGTAMPRQELLSPAQRAELLALPNDPLRIAAGSLLTPTDLELIARHRRRRDRIRSPALLLAPSWPGLGTRRGLAADLAPVPGRSDRCGTGAPGGVCPAGSDTPGASGRAPGGFRLADLRLPRGVRIVRLVAAPGSDYRSRPCTDPGAAGGAPSPPHPGTQPVRTRPPGLRGPSSRPARRVPRLDCGSHRGAAHPAGCAAPPPPRFLADPSRLVASDPGGTQPGQHPQGPGTARLPPGA